MDSINQSWGAFQNQAGDFVKMIADSQNMPEGVSDLFALKAVDNEGAAKSYDSSETYYKAMETAQQNAVNNQRNVSKLENDLFSKKAEYNDAMAGRTAALPEKTQKSGEN